ncbi:signal recognition particle-docking protein FtsY [Thermoflavifilum aggregans]|uniref:Signal recognition particle receptor FtsY n=1 Tax=Thermoflavifilum aggregans TaxID=454188 RepID=A0A2M9CX73_9BACT|nr:signal recognition particle-docking protein FtsY [Thermoflavifilum aggregans]MBX6381070.1 signal recognition particle-docking protein FtsY [Thermoflavifilum aggregans]PJJ76487.1 signal recognition particle-docking protein FtsY [Thermoflavifilum aggregans]
MSIWSRFFSREKQAELDSGLQKTRDNLWSRLGKLFTGKSTIDDEWLDELEEALISADVGIDTTVEILNRLQQRAARERYRNSGELQQLLEQTILSLLPPVQHPAAVQPFQLPDNKRPYVILVVGVNGVGKTTTIGKLAYQYKQAGYQVLLGAADTFRAAAVDQLTIWSERAGVPLVKQAMGADPGAVAFDTVQSAIARNMDVAIIDTAGRLHNKKHLMDELGKIRRVISKKLPGAPHEVLLVLDGSTGQNALEQAKQFMAVTELTGLVVTKLDGTAKGGVVLAIAHQCQIPIRYIGLGEKITDLQPFDPESFVHSLFARDASV